MKYKVEYMTDRPDEVIEADHFTDTKDGTWIDFYQPSGHGDYERIVRVRAAEVARIQEEGTT